ncbi:MAG: pilus assembly protein TadG-related protein [Candidatus Contubernalis sp.]|nr:pilus assembly protein TadG-related protein [Candidatus Contubernalis sp.]
MPIKKILKDEKGTALVLFALAIFVLFGFAALVIDVGDMYVERRNMVNAADAAALAGVKELALTGNDSHAITVAKEYAEEKNGAEVCEVEIITKDGEKVIHVKASINKQHYFAKIIGFSDIMISASATATWGYPTGLKNLLPIFYQFEEEGLPVGQQIALGAKQGPGNWGLIDVGGDPMEVLAGQSSSNELIFVGDSRQTITGNIPQHRKIAIRERLEKASNPESGVTMVGFLPIVTGYPPQGNSPLTVVGFAAFKITDVITDKTKDVDEDKKKWYGVGSDKAHFPDAPRLYSEGYDQVSELNLEFPEGTVIGEFLSDVFIPATEWISSTQDPALDNGMYMVRLTQ